MVMIFIKNPPLFNFSYYLLYMNNFKTILDDTINKLCHKAKGILAADESIGTIGKRFADINVDNNLENRINYRHLLFNTPNLNKYISGVITFDETIKSTYNNSLVIDPHTSVGLEAAYNYNYSLNGPCIVLSTAHPVKFADAVSSAININSDLPEKYKNIFSLDEKDHSLKNNLDTIKNFIDSTSNV